MEKKKFSEWIAAKTDPLRKAGDYYDALPETSKKCIDYAIERYVIYLDESTSPSISAEGENSPYEILYRHIAKLPNQTDPASDIFVRAIFAAMEEYSQSKTTAVKEVAVAYRKWDPNVEIVRMMINEKLNPFDYWITNIHNNNNK